MSDYIKQKDVLALQTELRFDNTGIEQLKHYRCRHIDPIEVELLPAADVRENVKSEWAIDAGAMLVGAFCLNCGKPPLCKAVGNLTFIDELSPFCPWCGADMRGEQDV